MKTMAERIAESRKYLNEFKARTSLSLHELGDIEDEFSDEDDGFNYMIEGISNIPDIDKEGEDDED
jgi:hypothetical protein